jgi:hypothetical protein
VVSQRTVAQHNNTPDSKKTPQPSIFANELKLSNIITNYQTKKQKMQ